MALHTSSDGGLLAYKLFANGSPFKNLIESYLLFHLEAYPYIACTEMHCNIPRTHSIENRIYI